MVAPDNRIFRERAIQRRSHVARFSTLTFLARVLNRWPPRCTTVIVIWPVLLTLRSWTVPVLPACLPAVTTERTPNYWNSFPAALRIAAALSLSLTTKRANSGCVILKTSPPC